MSEKKDWRKELPFIGKDELSINKKPAKKLTDILESCTKNQLKTFFYSYKADEGDIPSKKADLVQAAEKLIIENCIYTLIYDEEVTFDFYQQYLNCRNKDTGICDAELYIPDPRECKDEAVVFLFIMKAGLTKQLLKKGLLFKFDKKDGDELFVIPDEVYEEVTKHIQKDGTHPFGKKADCKMFADMLLSMYGVLSVRDFKILWETAFPDKEMSKEEIIDFMNFSSHDIYSYNFYKNKNIISNIILTEKQSQEILNDRARHTLYVPSRENLLKWFENSKDPDTDDALNSNGKFEFEYRNPYYIQMKKFLEKARKNDEDDYEILEDIMFYIKDGFMITQVINILNRDYKLTETMSSKEAERFFQIYQGLHNSTHQWVNYGSSPNELSGKKEPDLRFFSSPVPIMQNLPNEISFPKVGRNDPCPCGSGKKYKLCHGR